MSLSFRYSMQTLDAGLIDHDASTIVEFVNILGRQ